MSRAMLSVLAAWACTMHAARSYAQERRPTPGDVEVELAGSDTDLRRLTEVLSELLGRSPARVRWHRVATIAPADVLGASPDPSLRARAWIDVSATTARVYLTDATSARFLVRNFELPHGVGEVAREQIAHVVAASIDALMQGEEIGITRAQASAALGVAGPNARSDRVSPGTTASPSSQVAVRPAPPSLPTAVAPTNVPDLPSASTAGRGGQSAVQPAQGSFRGDLDLAYAISIFAPPNATLAHGPTLAFAGRIGTGVIRAVASVGASLTLPVAIDADPIGVRLDTVGVRASGGFHVSPARDWALRALAGIGADVVHIEPTTRFGSGAQLAPARYAATPIVTLQLSVQLRVADRLALFVAAGADFDLRGTFYQATYSGQSVSVLSPWVARPTFLLGLRTVVAGADDRTARGAR